MSLLHHWIQKITTVVLRHGLVVIYCLSLDLQDKMSKPMAFLAEIQGYTIYFHQAIAQEDSGDFVEPVVKKVNGHIDNAHWKLVPA